MGDENRKGLSINAKILIIILLFVDIGYALKLFDKYYKSKDSGYIRERSLYEQLEQRVMKSFGNREELNKLINDFIQYKEAAEKFAASFKEQGEQLKLVDKKLEESKANFEEEKARLQMERWALEDSLSQAKYTLRDRELEIQELNDRLKIVEEALLQKQIEDHSEIPGTWYLPVQ